MLAAAVNDIQISKYFDSPWGKPGFGLGELVSVMLSNAVVIAGIIMFVLMVAGGVGVIAGAGRDDPQAAANGKKLLTGAIIGFIIVFAAYWIIEILEVLTGVNILNSAL